MDDVSVGLWEKRQRRSTGMPSHLRRGYAEEKRKKYGLKVYLCGDRCHRNGTKSVHRNSETMLSLHQWGQRKAMMKNNWTIEEFRQEFHKKLFGGRSMINNVVIMGRLTKDPELKTTQSGLSVVSFTVAVDRNCQKDGERRADFLNVVAWRQTAEFVENTSRKAP